MKSCLVLPSLIVICQTLFGQNPQPRVAFPFNMVLTRPDSTEINSDQVFVKGKPTVVAFWLSTCGPCQTELDAYKQHYAEWKKQVDFNLVVVSIDFPQRFRKVGEMADKAQWPFPIYWDRTRFFSGIMPGELNGLPQVFLFDQEGKLIWQHRKYWPGDELALFEQIKALPATGK